MVLPFTLRELAQPAQAASVKTIVKFRKRKERGGRSTLKDIFGLTGAHNEGRDRIIY